MGAALENAAGFHTVPATAALPAGQPVLLKTSGRSLPDHTDPVPTAPTIPIQLSFLLGKKGSASQVYGGLWALELGAWV